MLPETLTDMFEICEQGGGSEGKTVFKPQRINSFVVLFNQPQS
jgi:hypothetical protein